MEETMSKAQAMLTYIKLNPFDVIVMLTGMFSATVVALNFSDSHPWLHWAAFPVYVLSATCAVYANFKRQIWPMVGLFGYYILIDTIGVFRWFPN